MELLGPESPRFVTGSWLNPTAQAWLQDLDSLATDEEHALARFAGNAAGGLSGWVMAPVSRSTQGARADHPAAASCLASS